MAVSKENREARIIELAKARLDCYGVANPLDDEIFSILIMLGKYDEYSDWEMPSYTDFEEE